LEKPVGKHVGRWRWLRKVDLVLKKVDLKPKQKLGNARNEWRSGAASLEWRRAGMGDGEGAIGWWCCGGRKTEKANWKKAQTREKRRREEEDGSYTSSPKGTHKEAVKHHKGCGEETTRVQRAFLRRKKQKNRKNHLDIH
jgi:hypothetical protein